MLGKGKKQEEKKGKKEKLKKQSKKKKEEKQKYIPLKGLMGNADDYHVYHMKNLERLIAFLIGFLGGVIVIFVFFRSTIFSILIGIVCGVLIQKPFREYQRKKRLTTLLVQFKDLLESLSASYSAGANTYNAFEDASTDLKSIYGNSADIVKEMEIIIVGMKNNFILEALLKDFADRTGLEDVQSFADVFEICNRQGGDMKKIISDTRDIINDKIEIEMDIQTTIAGSKNQLYIMMAMPLVIMISLSGMSDMSAVSNNFTNVLVKLVSLGIFALSYYMGRKIIDIKV